MLPEAAPELQVREAIAALGPLAAFRQRIAENDQRARGPELVHGRELAAARTAIYAELVRHWILEQQEALGYRRPFAIVALGGTGRAEMAPCSDTDFAFLFDDPIEGNPFLLELQNQTLHSDAFARRYGFAFQPLPFGLDDMPNLSGKQLNSFLDMRPVYDPAGLADRFRERIRATFDPFAQFLHVRGFWKDAWEKAAGESERLDRFDIKNDALRVFLAAIWTVGGKRFVHSHQVYATLDDPRDLEAYSFLLRIRAFIHTRRQGSPQLAGGGGSHPEDVLGFEDFTSFGEMLGPEASEQERFEFGNRVRARLLSARRRVASFAKGIIEKELADGRQISPGSPIFCGVGGLHYRPAGPEQSGREKTRAALSLLLASQHYGVRVAPSELQTTFRNAGDWLELTPELSALFYEPQGSLADSLGFLSEIAGAEERLFPGYARFEASLDARVMAERRSLRGALERQKLRALEQFVRAGRERLARAGSSTGSFDPAADPKVSVEVEAALLDADHLAAVKLALKTKRLPLTPHDRLVREDTNLPLHERLSTGMSGIPLAEYYQRYATQCDFPPQTVRMAEFLVANRRAFRERAEAGLNNERQVAEFAKLCGDDQLLRALYVFTNADRAEWESRLTDPVRWFNTDELYTKAMRLSKPAADPARSLYGLGFTPEEVRILQDFGPDLFGGVYRPYLARFGAQLVGLAQAPATTGPRASLIREGAATIVGVAARDYRGLAAVITGALWHQGLDLRQAHLFSAMHYGLALDFFHVAQQDKPLPASLPRTVEAAIQQQLFIAEADEPGLPRVPGAHSLREWQPGQCCLRFETTHDARGTIYALSYKVFRHLRGNIFGLTAHSARGNAYVTIYLSLPDDLPLAQAQAIVQERF
jgi:hypothetical protein